MPWVCDDCGSPKVSRLGDWHNINTGDFVTEGPNDTPYCQDCGEPAYIEWKEPEKNGD